MKSEFESCIKERIGMSLYEFIKQKVEVDTLHDYEIASVLNVNPSSIGKFRKAYGIKKANGFSRRFERTYGEGAVEAFKKMIENPDSSLTDVGRHFGFSREYARQVYKKIYGRSYAEAYKRKRLRKKKKRLVEGRRKSKQIGNLIKVSEKLKSMGLVSDIMNKGRSYMILTNGYKVALRATFKPVMINKKEYFRINNARRTNTDFDFFTCLCRNRKEDIHFIIPSNVMPRSTVSLLPQATPDQSKYAQFKEAWHLLVHKNSKDKSLSKEGHNDCQDYNRMEI